VEVHGPALRAAIDAKFAVASDEPQPSAPPRAESIGRHVDVEVQGSSHVARFAVVDVARDLGLIRVDLTIERLDRHSGMLVIGQLLRGTDVTLPDPLDVVRLVDPTSGRAALPVTLDDGSCLCPMSSMVAIERGSPSEGLSFWFPDLGAPSADLAFGDVGSIQGLALAE
jgi:hypothetical protein